MKKMIVGLIAAFCCLACAPKPEFVSIDGPDLRRPDGSKLEIRGTNLGNWLNPEGYMFGLRNTSSAGFINTMLCELVGPDVTADFWKAYKENYISEEDIRFIASQGANTVRLPFHYKLFTDEDYMGLSSDQDGFLIVDRLVEWCRNAGLYLILDMHDCPGGQTGDNIDDSYGYPWLFESPASRELFKDIWRRIAEHYADESVILGYELMNEPIATYFDDKHFNPMLEPLYKETVAEIRKVDRNHIIILGGPQWNSRFDNFSDWSFDDKIMYSCHRYGGDACKEAIGNFSAFRDKTGLPMYMGEIGHNTTEWQNAFCNAMRELNIGWTFWPYKKMGDSCMMGIEIPEGWQAIVDFAEGDRSSYAAIREHRPDQEAARASLEEFLVKCRFENCIPQTDYIKSIQLDQ